MRIEKQIAFVCGDVRFFKPAKKDSAAPFRVHPFTAGVYAPHGREGTAVTLRSHSLFGPCLSASLTAESDYLLKQLQKIVN